MADNALAYVCKQARVKPKNPKFPQINAADEGNAPFLRLGGGIRDNDRLRHLMAWPVRELKPLGGIVDRCCALLPIEDVNQLKFEICSN